MKLNLIITLTAAGLFASSIASADTHLTPPAPPGGSDPVTTDPVVEPEPVADADPVEPVADADPVEPVADADPVEPVADADPVEPVADADPVEPVADADPVVIEDPVIEPVATDDPVVIADPVVADEPGAVLPPPLPPTTTPDTEAGPTVAAVPVPAAVWLFGTGLLGLVGLSRRKKN